MTDRDERPTRQDESKGRPTLTVHRAGCQNSESPEENVVPWKDCVKVRRAKKLRGGNAEWYMLETQSFKSSRARGPSRASGLPGKTVRFSDEPARPTQTIQQHVPDQPDTVDVTDSQREKEETTQCVASTRSGHRVRVPVRYQHN